MVVDASAARTGDVLSAPVTGDGDQRSAHEVPFRKVEASV
jgi:hypothetical protein